MAESASVAPSPRVVPLAIRALVVPLGVSPALPAHGRHQADLRPVGAG